VDEAERTGDLTGERLGAGTGPFLVGVVGLMGTDEIPRLAATCAGNATNPLFGDGAVRLAAAAESLFVRTRPDDVGGSCMWGGRLGEYLAGLAGEPRALNASRLNCGVHGDDERLMGEADGTGESDDVASAGDGGDANGSSSIAIGVLLTRAGRIAGEGLFGDGFFVGGCMDDCARR